MRRSVYPQQAPPPVPAFTAHRTQLNTTADALILAGAIIGIALTALTVIMSLFFFLAFASAFEQTGFGPLPSVALWMPVMLIVTGALTIVGSVIAFSARSELKRTDGVEGATKAIVAGALMIVGMGMLGGVLVLIGGILAAQRPTGR